MILLWEIDTEVEPAWLSLMQTAADCALWAEGVTRPCAVSVRLCDDEAIHEINREYRDTDRATDVLSFPTVNYPKGVTVGTRTSFYVGSWTTSWTHVCWAI